MPPVEIVVVGSTMMELITEVDRMPSLGETVVGRSFRFGHGGKGANQAVMAARLGSRVCLVGRVGSDLFGRMTREHLTSTGVELRVEAIEAEATGTAPIWVDGDGANRIVVVPGANLRLTADVVASEMDRIGGARCVVCQLEAPQEAALAAFTAARRWGATTILNPAPSAPLDPDLLASTDWLIPNETEFELLFGTAPSIAAVRTAAAALPGGIVVTIGSGGALAELDGAIRHQPAPAVEVADTTGAGDAFVGGFAHALASGLAAPEAVSLGNVCGALSVTVPGTQTALPSAAEIGASGLLSWWP